MSLKVRPISKCNRTRGKEDRASLGKGVRTPMRKVFRVPIENGLQATKWKGVRAPMEKGFGVEAFWQRGFLAHAKLFVQPHSP